MKKNNPCNKSRRDFLKKTLVGSALLPFLSLATLRSVEALAADQKEVSKDDPMVKALGYYSDASKVDTQKWAKRATAEGKKQFCDNCSFYTAGKGGLGKCSIIQSGLVRGKGWCNSWVAKS